MSENNECWAVVDLMGHITIAGRVTKPGEYGGLWQIDIPKEESYCTEFFSSQSVYRIRIVSEEIARAYALQQHEVIEYNAPIVTRAEYENAIALVQEKYIQLKQQNEILKERLIAINALPAPSEDGEGVYIRPDV
jgi:hypothetical protein